MSTKLHSFYNDTYSGQTNDQSYISIPEYDLITMVTHTLTNNVVYRGEMVKLSDLWSIRYYTGGSIPTYKNKYTAGKILDLLDFSKIHLLTEIYRNNIGLRFFTSLTERKMIVELVSYRVNGGYETEARLERRFNGSTDEMLCMANMINMITIAQELFTDQDGPLEVVLH